MKRLLSVILILFTIGFAQDIINKLGTSGNYNINDSSDNILFRVQDDGRVAIGMNPSVALLSVDNGTQYSAILGQSANDYAVVGRAQRTTGTNYGGFFESMGPTGIGVYGLASNTDDNINYGGYFLSHGTKGYGVYGVANGASGVGLFGKGTYLAAYFDGGIQINGGLQLHDEFKDASGDVGTSGQILSSTVTGTDWIDAPSGVATESDPTLTDDGSVIIGNGAENVSLTFNSDAGTDGAITWDGTNDQLEIINGDVGIGTNNPSRKLEVVDGTLWNDSPAIYGKHFGGSNYGIGVSGDGNYIGVEGNSNTTGGTGFAISGTAAGSGSSNIYGVSGFASGSGNGIMIGVYGGASGSSTGNRYGVYGSVSGGSNAYAGYFSGDVEVAGTFSKGGGSFKIDHPLDPENKYLSHSFVESPDMMNIYNGNVILNRQGEAVVEMPDWFEPLNKDFRYQLTSIGGWAPLFIAEEISGNRFRIAGGEPGMKVSWQVTGIRQDAFANANRIQVEEQKSTDERGKYLHPDVFGLSRSMSVNYEHEQRAEMKATKD